MSSRSSKKTETRVTLAEIAKHADVSKTAVSFVLNGKGAVSGETTARVLAVAKELGYEKRPRVSVEKVSAGNGGDAQGMPGVIALIWVNTTESWRQSHLAHLLIQTISARLEEHGGRLRTIYHNETDAEPIPDLSDVGALFVAGSPRSDFWEKLPSSTPRLNLMCKPYVTDCSFLDIDSVHSGYALTKYLLDLGHRKIGFVSNSRNHRSFNLRYLGYYRALDEFGIVPHPGRVVRLSQPQGILVETTRPTSDIEPGLEKMLALPEEHRPSAIVAANDWNAAAVYQYVNRAGLRIPEDLSVVGCDNDPGVCDFLKPALTTFSIPYMEMANDAVDWMLSLVQGKPLLSQPVMMQFRGKLVVRASVKKLE